MKKLLKFKDFVDEMLVIEGGNAIDEARPIKQSEVDKTYDYVLKKVLPVLDITEDFVKPIGSFKKKSPEQTSGDIDIAVLADKIASVNGIGLDQVLDFMEEALTKAGFHTIKTKGFQQVSIAVPIEGDKKNGYAQIDLMLTDSLDFSTFMYHSPDFTKAESKYKGLYRNILLMNIISNSKRETSKLTDDGEVEEYKSYVLRLNQGVVAVTKSYAGKKGLVKNPKLLKDQDKFITNTPEIITELAFGPGIPPSEIMTFEDIWRYTTSPKFIHKDKLNDILKDFNKRILQTKVPIPSECIDKFPNIFS